jgi:uncharacterized membrane protein YfcA
MLSIVEISALILSGIIVAFINTFAGGASVISISLFMVMGMSPFQATVINRLPVFFQTMASSYIFYKKKMLDWKRGLSIGIPIVMGCLIGSNISIVINKQVFNICLGLILLMMLFFIFYKPEVWLKGNAKVIHKKLDWQTFAVFLLVGVYAGFLHVGVGYLILGGLVLMLGYDLMRGNAMKNFLVLLYSPFVLGFFIINGDLTLKMATYGLIHAIGNVIGATLATHLGTQWGNNFIRWLMLVVILLTAMNLFGLIDFSALSKIFPTRN